MSFTDRGGSFSTKLQKSHSSQCKTVLFYLKKGAEKRNGEVIIMARVTFDGKVCHFSTKQSIHPDNWNVKAGKATGKSSVQINKLLDDIKASLNQI
jgi:hypothetical protein